MSQAATPTLAATAPSRYASGVVLAIGGTFLFALKSIFIKLAYAAGAEPLGLLTLRMGFSLPFYLAVLPQLRANSGGPRIKPRDVGLAMLLGFLGYYLASYLDLAGLTYITAQLERLTLFTYPSMVALLAAMFLGEKLTPRVVAALVLSYLGVALLYRQEKQLATGTASDQLAWGAALVVGSALSYSLYILLAKPMMQRIGSRLFTSLAMIGSTVFVGIHFAASRPVHSLGDLPAVVYAYGLVLAIGCTVLPSFMINESIVRIGAARTTIIGTVGPVLTVLLAVLLLGEPTSIYHAAGMLLAVVGVSLVAVK